MQLLVTPQQMQRLDEAAITRSRIPGLLLMENAGRAFVDELEKRVGSLSSKRVVVICGKGNNGGDGFVIARHLLNRGCIVHVGLVSKRSDVKGDAKTNFDIFLKILSSKKAPASFTILHSPKASAQLPHADIIVDALFGTGFSGHVMGIQQKIILWMNSQKAFVASVDIPSGVDASTGVVENFAVKADMTVTMGLGKIGHYVGDGREHSGYVSVVDVSIPKFLFKPEKHPTYRVLGSDVKSSLPERPLTAHKYSAGKVLLIAGSRNLTGAPIMTAQAAMKAGAGAGILLMPKSIHPALVRKLTEVMMNPMDETDEGTLALSSFDKIMEKVLWADVVALGPGLSQNLETRRLVHKLVAEIWKPLVLDADGLGMMAYDISILKKRRCETIITPHVGELRLLTKLDRDFIETNRVEVARSQAKQLNCTLVLKGSPTVTGSKYGEAYLNSTGNPGMATAGSGDVLTGIVASFLAQGMMPDEAAYCGVYVHGMAGDIAVQKYGQRGMMATDILECIGEALRRIEHD